ncbi:MAG: LysM peptidoglycan-binding domain-containing protein [Gemmatimonadota bacterium]|nr:LysM peptidoglycan-binding domain-containing protein [Gemmatimonadota bacterium]
MVRSAAAVVALLILPSFAQGQEVPGTHTVVDRDTLWDLAQFYYQDPFQWRVIFEANQDSIADEDLIYPREVFVIPGIPGTRTPTTTTTAAVPLPQVEPQDIGPTGSGDLVQFGFRQARPAQQVRSMFYQDTAAARGASRGVSPGNRVAVTRDAVYSAPWVVRIGAEAERTGVIDGFADEGQRALAIRSYDRVRMTMPSPARVGAQLQTFRIMRSIESVGEVAVPTGIVTVSAISDVGVIGVVTKEYQRILAGDFVRPVPSYTVQPGAVAQEVSGGSEAMIMGFAGVQVLNDLGQIAFLDLGSNDGITIGDVFVLYGVASANDPRGSLEVVGLTPSMASARIASMVDAVFRQGVIVRLARKMP